MNSKTLVMHMVTKRADLTRLKLLIILEVTCIKALVRISSVGRKCGIKFQEKMKPMVGAETETIRKAD